MSEMFGWKLKNMYFCTMKSNLNPEHPLVVNAQRIKENGIAILYNVTTLPNETEPFAISDYVISICHRGTMNIINDTLPETITPGTIGIVLPNRPIQFVSKSDDFLNTLIVVDSELVDDPLLQIIHRFQYRFENHPSVVLGEREYKVMMKVVDVMHETSKFDIQDHRMMMIRQLYFFLRLLAYYRQRMLNDDMAHKPVGTHFLANLEQHWQEHHDVGFYADLACLTPKYFSSRVKEDTGHNATYWIHSQVIRKAKEMLFYQPDLPIQDIADKLGFCDQQTFSRYFRRETGISPTEFRRMK